MNYLYISRIVDLFFYFPNDRFLLNCIHRVKIDSYSRQAQGKAENSASSPDSLILPLLVKILSLHSGFLGIHNRQILRDTVILLICPIKRVFKCAGLSGQND